MNEQVIIRRSVLDSYHRDGLKMERKIRSLEDKLEIAIEALEYYASCGLEDDDSINGSFGDDEISVKYRIHKGRRALEALEKIK